MMKLKLFEEFASELNEANNNFLRGLVAILRDAKRSPEGFHLSDDLQLEIDDAKLTSSDIYNLSSLFKGAGMTRRDITSGQLESRIKSMYIDKEVIEKNLAKAKALKNLMNAIDKYTYGDSTFYSKYK